MRGIWCTAKLPLIVAEQADMYGQCLNRVDFVGSVSVLLDVFFVLVVEAVAQTSSRRSLGRVRKRYLCAGRAR